MKTKFPLFTSTWQIAEEDSNNIKTVSDFENFYRSYDLDVAFSHFILKIDQSIIQEYILKNKDMTVLIEYLITALFFNEEDTHINIPSIINCIDAFDPAQAYTFVEKFLEYNLMYPEHRMNETFYSAFKNTKIFMQLTQ